MRTSDFHFEVPSYPANSASRQATQSRAAEALFEQPEGEVQSRRALSAVSIIRPTPTRSTPMARSTAAMCRLRPAISAEGAAEEERGQQERQAEAERVGAHQQEPAPGGAALGGERQDGAEHRADAGRPAEGEGEAEDVGAERGAGLGRAPRSGLRARGTAGAARRGNAARRARRRRRRRSPSRAGRRGAPRPSAEAARPSSRKTVESPRTKKRAARSVPAVAAAEPLHRGAGHEGEVGRHDRQHAGREEAQHAGRGRDEERGNERSVPEVDPEHAAAIGFPGRHPSGSPRRRHRPRASHCRGQPARPPLALGRWTGMPSSTRGGCSARCRC